MDRRFRATSRSGRSTMSRSRSASRRRAENAGQSLLGSSAFHPFNARRHRNSSRACGCLRARTDGYPVQPHPHRRRCGREIALAPGGQNRFLNRVVGVLWIAEHQPAKRLESGPIALEEYAKRLLIARARRGQQGTLVRSSHLVRQTASGARPHRREGSRRQSGGTADCYARSAGVRTTTGIDRLVFVWYSS